MTRREEVHLHAIAATFQKITGLSAEVRRATEIIVASLRAGNRVYFCGNGGSAADAQHLAAELLGRVLIDRDPFAAVALNPDSNAPKDAKVAVLGYSFKTNSGDCRFTPVAPFLKALKAAGYSNVAVCDPTVSKTEAAQHGLSLIPDWRDALDGAEIQMPATPEKVWRALGTQRSQPAHDR